MVDKNYRLQWAGMKNCSIYVQTGSRHTHGISDHTLSIFAYRSAKIANAVANEHLYPDIDVSSLLEFE